MLESPTSGLLIITSLAESRCWLSVQEIIQSEKTLAFFVILHHDNSGWISFLLPAINNLCPATSYVCGAGEAPNSRLWETPVCVG